MQAYLSIIAEVVPASSTNGGGDSNTAKNHPLFHATGHILTLAFLAAMGAAVIAAFIKPPFRR